MKVDLFGDNIGAVEYVSHMGTDLSVVNAARVSFGTRRILNSSTILCSTIIVLLLNIVYLLLSSLYLCLYAPSIIDTVLGHTMRSVDDILQWM